MDRLFILVIVGFPGGLAGKQSACNMGDLGSIPGLGRSPGEKKGYLLQYSGLENSADCIVHRVSKSQTQLSDFHFHFYSDKESSCQCRRPRFNPWVGKILWRKNGNPLQYSCLGNPMDSGTWCALAHGAAESQATLNDKGQKTKHKFTLAPASPCLWCACLSVCRGVCVM